MNQINRLFASILLTLILIFNCPLVYAGQSSDRPESVIKHQLDSKILQEQRDIFVMLPKGYKPNEKLAYDVVYVIDSNRLAYNLSQDMDILSRNDRIPNSIVISIPKKNSSTRLRDLTPPFLKRDLKKESSELGQADRFLDFIESEVAPMIKSHYKTTANKILLGHSRAGLLVIYSLLYKAELFSGRVALSPALWRQDNLIVSELSKHLKSIDSHPSYLYMSMGVLEVEKMKHALKLTVDLLEKQPSNMLDWDSHYQAFADHKSNPYLTASTGLLAYYQHEKSNEDSLANFQQCYRRFFSGS